MVEVPRIVDGRYRVDRLVGRGGFGAVYAGHHLTLDVPLAIKVLHLERATDPSKRADAIAAFLEEGRLLVRLRHPNIVAALDLGVLPTADEGGPTPYLVLEWVDGTTLQAVLAERRAPFSLDRAWALFRPIVEAVAFAHAARVVHRDLKPGNVMLARGPNGTITPRVIDFGVAKSVHEDATAGSGATETQSPGAAFTPAYAAPEQMTLARTGPWTDVHALGLLFVELVTGERAYPELGVRLAVIDPERPSPRARGVDVGAFEDVIAKALAIRPAARFADAGEMLAACDAAAASTIGHAVAPIATSELGDASSSNDAERAARAVEAPNVAPTSETSPESTAGVATPPVERSIATAETTAASGSARAAGGGDPTPRLDSTSEAAAPKANDPSNGPGARRVGARAAIGAATLGLAAIAAIVLLARRHDDARPAPANARALDRSSIVACPVLEASGVEAPSGWLGAAAADALCRRIRWRLGGSGARVRGPGELLDVPRAPTEGFAIDPYGAADARSRTVVAAKVASAFVDGSITRGATSTTIALRLVDHGGGVLGEATATSNDLFDAVNAALARLDEQDVFPPRALEDETKRVQLVTTVEQGLALEELDAREDPRACDTLRASASAIPARWPALRALCDPTATAPATTLDRSSPFALGFTALAALATDPKLDVPAVAKELGAAREHESSSEGRSTLALMSAIFESMIPGELDAARDDALRALADDPTDPSAWRVVNGVLQQRAEPAPFAQAAAFAPSNADVWLSLGLSRMSRPERATFLRRAYALRGCFGDLMAELGGALIDTGALGEAESLAAACASPTPNGKLATSVLRARLDLARGMPGRAYDDARAALLAHPSYGGGATFDALLVALRSATLLGVERDLADALLDRFVLAEPPRLEDSTALIGDLGRVALAASKPRGLAAIARIRALAASKVITMPERDVAWLEGASLAIRGDAKGAVAAWRKGMGKDIRLWMPAAVFDAAGEVELADELDRTEDAQPVYFGLGLAGPRIAERAWKRGDKDKARAIARDLVTKWSTSDRSLPAVAAMRALLSRPG